MIGLGVAIDCALLIVVRWRQERVRGVSNELAVKVAMQTAGRAVVFSGTTVGIGLLALAVLPVPFLQSIGFGGLLIPLVTVAVACTLLPVVLATAGPRIDRAAWSRAARDDRLWRRWAGLVVRNRWAGAGTALAVLVALAIPAVHLYPGEPRADALATSGPARDAPGSLERAGIPAGVLTPFEGIAHGNAASVRRIAAAAKDQRGVPTCSRPRARHGIGAGLRRLPFSRPPMATRRPDAKRSPAFATRRDNCLAIRATAAGRPRPKISSTPCTAASR